MDAALRALVRRRARERCEYCHIPQSADVLPFQIDHIVAEKHHGATSLENLALSCFNCNVQKGPDIAGIDPLTGRLEPLFNPRQDAWEEHFGWCGAELRGRTALGRATIDVLRINLPARLDLRRILADAGLMPI